MSSPNATPAAILIGALLIALGIFFGLQAAAPRYAVSAAASGYAVRTDVKSGATTVCLINKCSPAVEDGIPAGYAATPAAK